MPRKTKIEPEPEGAEEIETVEANEETKEEEIEEDKPITKPVVYKCGLTPVKIFYRLCLQKFSPA
jgi:hypothetical protein